MSMALSREIRLPFLDHRVVSLLLPLAPQWKLRDGWSKWVFRKAMEPDLPPEITWRKDKQGFDNPQSQWLRRELRSDVETLLGGELLTARAGFIDAARLRQRYTAYRRQGSDRGAMSFKDIFNPLALEIWARRFETYLSLES
jgi:asparagine synthase (glutamine-hydrolysing)